MGAASQAFVLAVLGLDAPAEPQAADGGAAETAEEGEVREIEVPALPREARTVDFEHAGSRISIDGGLAQESGAASVTDALAKVPGVQALEGNAGLGSTSTKLNFGVRGVNPRFSSRSTVLLDGIPVAAAPYGQPQLSLFPVSLFSIRRLDVMRGGAPLSYGPQTAGGVLNLISAPIPNRPTVRAMAQANRWGSFALGAAYAGTHRGLGMHVEYAPRYGHGYRDHSKLQVHGGLVKLAHDVGAQARTTTSIHYFFEDSNLPGGISRTSFDDDPYGSDRPRDEFSGWRLGASNRLEIDAPDDDEAGVTAFYNHSARASVIANGPLGDADTIRYQPRVLDTVGLEPSYRLVGARDDLVNELVVGTRGVLELASIRVLAEPYAGGARGLELESNDVLIGWATYVEDGLHLHDSRVVLRAGVRAEVVRIDEQSSLAPDDIDDTFWAPLPAASVWVRPVEPLALFAAYRRSFGSPQFLQVAVAPPGATVRPETADTVEGGLKLMEQGGLAGEATGWFQAYRDLVDVGLSSYTEVGDTHAWGMDVDLQWNMGQLWPSLSGLVAQAGWATMQGHIISGPFEGGQLPWAPRHAVLTGLAYERATFRIAADVIHEGSMFTDYANTVVEPPDGAIGLIDPHTLVDLTATALVAVRGQTKVRFSIGVTNLLGEQWFLRTDDRNRGILPMRPRTVHGTIVVEHAR